MTPVQFNDSEKMLVPLVEKLDTISTTILALDHSNLAWLSDILKDQIRNEPSARKAMLLAQQLRQVRAIHHCLDSLLAS